MKRLSKVSFNKQNYVYLKAEMRWNSYSTYDDLVDPTLFNEYEYVDIIKVFYNFLLSFYVFLLIQ